MLGLNMVTTPSFARLRLLIVDDDPLLAEFLREGLKTHFSLIMVVAGVAQAKSLMEGPFVFHAIVCDYQLADGTGIDFYTWLRKACQNPVPFLMISGKVDPISIDDPAFDFLAKPFLLPHFLEVLQRLPFAAVPLETSPEQAPTRS
jgi:two-component system, OmpR family, response regulator QseB